MDAAAEIGRNHIQPEYGGGQADAGRDCRTRLARPKFSGASGHREIGNINFPCSADHEQNWQPYPVDPYFCYM